MKILVVVVIFIVVLIGGFLALKSQNRSSQPAQIVATPTPSPQSEIVDIKASFTIITNGLTRNFTASMYHNLSPDVYIESSDPSAVYVKKKGITWNNFFATLPMKLTKECLTTGTGQKFCTGENGKLQFYLNDKEEKDLLDREIRDGDKVRVEFR